MMRQHPVSRVIKITIITLTWLVLGFSIVYLPVSAATPFAAPCDACSNPATTRVVTLDTATFHNRLQHLRRARDAGDFRDFRPTATHGRLVLPHKSSSKEWPYLQPTDVV